MIDVQHRALRALEQHLAARGERVVDVARGVGHVRRKPVAQAASVVENLLVIERLFLESRAQIDVLLGQVPFELFREHAVVQQIDEADADPRHLVLVGRADAAAGGADLAGAAQPLPGQVDGLVVGHDEMGEFADLERLRVGQPAARLQGVDLLDEHLGVDHHAVADHAHFAVVQHA